MIDTENFKIRLEKELALLKKQLGTVGEENPNVTNDWVAIADDQTEPTADPVDLADANEELENNTAIIADLETRHNNILLALKKIEAGTYGICEISGEEIEADRLEANPAARTCKKHLENETGLTS